MTVSSRTPQKSSELALAISASKRAFVGVAFMSGAVNILMLAGSIYMLQVYDRAIPSASIPTLVALSAVVGFAFVAMALFDALRQRILTRIGATLDERLSPRVYRTIVETNAAGRPIGDGVQPIRDLDMLRGFLSSQGPTALFDLPWLPLYVGLCFLMHPLLGWATLIGALSLIVLTLWTDMRSRVPMEESLNEANARLVNIEAARNNAEALVGMGMTANLHARFQAHNRRSMIAHEIASDIAANHGSIAKTFRLILQSAVLGLGAYLVIIGEATGGVMIAASILSARALAPIDVAIASWRPFLSARMAWARLAVLLNVFPQRADPLSIPPPKRVLEVKDVVVVLPRSAEPALAGVSFGLGAGAALGVIGPSAAGKSTLARVLVGAYPAQRGEVRLDGGLLEAWSEAARCRFIGYLPQTVALFDGTVAENISRFDPAANPEEIVAAAKAAGSHEMILSLANGYETQLGEQGVMLSSGQRQRIALARALFRDPFLVVLDEPNSSLDQDGDLALTRAILSVRERGGIAVVIAHRPSALFAVDQVLVLRSGRVQHFGPRDEVLAKVMPKPPARQPAPDGKAAAGPEPATVEVVR